MAKVLVVEDTEVNRIMLSQRLEKRGYEVVLAVDGEEGVVKARKDAPDIILLDMNLPKMDGWEVTHTLKESEQTKHIPIIALTAHSITKTRDATIGAGCDEYETKPVDFERLVAKMEDLMHKGGS
jgi:CheY-like chemotaxis protein